MFPTQTIKNQNLNIRKDETTITGKSFLFDFNTGEFVIKDGKLVEIDGYDALKIWINKVLKTTKNKFEIYNNTNYGITDFRELITNGFPLAFIKSEIEREVRNILLKNTSINSVENFRFERNKRLLTVIFDCNTVYGKMKHKEDF